MEADALPMAASRLTSERPLPSCGKQTGGDDIQEVVEAIDN